MPVSHSGKFPYRA